MKISFESLRARLVLPVPRLQGLSLIIAVLTATAWLFAVFLKPSWAMPIMLVGVSLVYLAIEWAEFKPDDTPENFFLYNRSMPVSEFVPTFVATNVGLFSSIFFSIYLAFDLGIAGMLWTLAAWFLGMYLFSKKIPQLLPFFKSGSTLHEFIANHFSKDEFTRRRLRMFTAIVTSTLYWASIAVEIRFGAELLTPQFGATTSTTIAILIALTGMIYSYFAGLRGAVHTDKIQAWVMYLGSGVILFFSGYLLFIKPLTIPSDFFSWKAAFIGPDPISIGSLIILLV